MVSERVRNFQNGFNICQYWILQKFISNIEVIYIEADGKIQSCPFISSNMSTAAYKAIAYK